MKKYYIEICDMESPCEYIMQSKWFDTEQEAIKWAKDISFLDMQYSISLMSSEWDVSDDTYTDIDFERYLKTNGQIIDELLDNMKQLANE